MLLNEFFGKSIDVDQNQKRQGEGHDPKMDDDLFWYIVDHDKMYKDYFFPIAKKLEGKYECEPEQILELFMPMVIKGCKEYYNYQNMKGKLGKVFSKELREELCKRLYDHYRKDVQEGKYKL